MEKKDPGFREMTGDMDDLYRVAPLLVNGHKLIAFGLKNGKTTNLLPIKTAIWLCGEIMRVVDAQLPEITQVDRDEINAGLTDLLGKSSDATH